MPQCMVCSCTLEYHRDQNRISLAVLIELVNLLVSLYTLSGEVIDHDHLDRTL